MIRVVAYNVSGGHQRRAAEQVLRAIGPDVVCLLESPARFPLRRMARRCVLAVASHARDRRSGVAVLTGDRVRTVSSVVHRLSAHPGSPDRSVVQAIVSVGALRLAVFALHLGLDPDVRALHRAEVERHLARVEVPVVLGADLNEPPGGPNVDRLGEVLVDGFAAGGYGPGHTFPNPEPITRKTFVFLDRRLAVGSAWIPEDPPVVTASHHRPLVVELAEPGERPVDEGPEEPAA